jgi:hypothetical protein
MMLYINLFFAVFWVFWCSSARRSALVAEKARTPIPLRRCSKEKNRCSKEILEHVWNTSGTPTYKLKIGFNRGRNTWNTLNTNDSRARGLPASGAAAFGRRKTAQEGAKIMNENLIPNTTLKAAKKMYGNSEPWRLYRFIGRNRFVQAWLLVRDGSLCPYCGKPCLPADKIDVHHLDYQHVCGFGRTVGNYNPSIADCESCHQERSDLFNGCMQRLKLVHQNCNAEIANVGWLVRGRESRNDQKGYFDTDGRPCLAPKTNPVR